jgi:hypothetical protein
MMDGYISLAGVSHHRKQICTHSFVLSQLNNHCRMGDRSCRSIAGVLEFLLRLLVWALYRMALYIIDTSSLNTRNIEGVHDVKFAVL